MNSSLLCLFLLLEYRHSKSTNLLVSFLNTHWFSSHILFLSSFVIEDNLLSSSIHSFHALSIAGVVLKITSIFQFFVCMMSPLGTSLFWDVHPQNSLSDAISQTLILSLSLFFLTVSTKSCVYLCINYNLTNYLMVNTRGFRKKYQRFQPPSIFLILC